MNIKLIIYRQLQNNTFSGLFVGQNIITLKTIGSTNNYLKNELSNSAPLPEGTVILAEEQTEGRGQQTAGWLSEPGKNLTFSILLKPGFLPVSEQFWLNKCISVALNEALNKITGIPFCIKWPNDIYAGDSKLGGMLIENIIRGSQWNYAIIGIGLNVNQQNFPASLPNAHSLSKILHRDYDLQALLLEICSYIEAWYLRLKAGHKSEIAALYLQHLYRFNKIHCYRKAGSKEFEGMLTNVTEEGYLELVSDGKVEQYSIKEIEFLINKA